MSSATNDGSLVRTDAQPGWIKVCSTDKLPDRGGWKQASGCANSMIYTFALPSIASLNQKTRHLLLTVWLATADYFINALIALAFAWLELVPFWLPFLLLGWAIIMGMAFGIAIASGWSKRFADPSLTTPQVLAACAANLLCAMFSPDMAYFFLMHLFVPLSYGALNFNRRIYTFVWLLLSAAIGMIFLVTQMPAPIENAMKNAPLEQRIMVWLAVSSVLARFFAVNARASRLRERVRQRNEELRVATARLAELASRDELTGLWNRREFLRLLQEESRRAVRNRTYFCVAIIDIDYFKRINEKFGHLIADAALQEMAQLLDFARRATDSVARYDNKRFSLLLTNAKLSTAMIAVERLRHQIMQHDWSIVANGLQLTASIGVVEWKAGETLVQLLNRSEQVLGEAKTAGRNCVRATTDRAPG